MLQTLCDLLAMKVFINYCYHKWKKIFLKYKFLNIREQLPYNEQRDQDLYALFHILHPCHENNVLENYYTCNIPVL